MNLPIVDFNTAKELKELGFDAPTIFAYNKYGKFTHKLANQIGKEPYVHYCEYDSDMYAPAITEVIKWFRDVHNLYINVTLVGVYKEKNFQLSVMDFNNGSFGERIVYKVFYNTTFEQAELEGIKKVIKYLKNGNSTKK